MAFRDQIMRAVKWLFCRLPHLPRDEYGMSDEEFFLAVLEEVPKGSQVYFDQSEPDKWIPRLKKWSYRRNQSQFEADYYVIDSEFLAELRTILNEEENALGPCYHIYVSSPDGELLLSSMDNFSMVELSEEIRDALVLRSGNV